MKIAVVDKSKSNYDLEKIPDSVLLKLAYVEIGKLQSYIQELESAMKANVDKIKLYESNEAKLSTYRMAKALRKSNDTNNRIETHNRQLEKQVFELTKKINNYENNYN